MTHPTRSITTSDSVLITRTSAKAPSPINPQPPPTPKAVSCIRVGWAGKNSPRLCKITMNDFESFTSKKIRTQRDVLVAPAWIWG